MKPLRIRRRGPGFVACLALLGTFVIENHCSLPVFEAQDRFDHLRLAHYYLRSGFSERALTEAGRALREDKDNVETLVVLARVYQQTGEVEKAVEILSSAIRLKPDDEGLFMLLHEVCVEADRPDLAVEAFERLFETSADNWHARRALGWAYERGDSTDVHRAARGLQLLEEAVADSTTVSAESLTFAKHQLADAYLRRARTEDAVKVVEAILGADPSDRFALLTLGQYHLERNNTDEAERLFDRLLVATKAPPALVARIAGLWYDAGHRRHAIRYYELALEEESPPATLLNNLAWTYAEEEVSLERARALSLRAVKEDADNVVFLDTYAEVLYRQGRTKQAAALLRRAVELEPEDGEHHDYLLQQLKKFSAASGFVVPGPPTSTE